MKKSTRKTLMALGIIFIFALSSIAFVFTGFSPQQSSQPQPLSGPVVEGEINPQLESAYIQSGYTFLKFYYNNEIDAQLVSFVNNAPETFATSGGQLQLIVVKIQSPTSYGRIVNINGAVDIPEMNVDTLFDSLCVSLLSPPPECVVGRINSTR